MFHTAARPAGVYLNNASCTAASLLDRDVFVFSRLSLRSSSIEEEKKLECGTGVVFISNKNLSFDLKPIKVCKQNGGEKNKHFFWI